MSFTGQVLELNDFSAGITDNVIGREPTRMATAKNMFITVDKSLTVRPGSIPEGNSDTLAKMPGGIPVNLLVKGFEDSDPPFKLSTSSTGRFIYFNGATHTQLLGPDGNTLFTASHGSASDNRFSVASWNGHHYLTSGSFTQKPQKVFRDAMAVLQLRTAGMPSVDGSGITFAAPGANSYIYAFLYRYSYTVANRTFLDRGPLTQLVYTGAIPNAMTGLPVLANGGTDNYDTTALTGVDIEIYRTINNGTVFYLVGSVNNGTTIFTDTVADVALVNNQLIYTAGGVVENDPPPICKFVHVSERGIGFYGYVKDGADEVKNRIRQSIAGDPDSCPASFFDDIDDEVTGISSFKGIPIAFGRNSVYRGDGIFDRFGNGGLRWRRIAESIGCVAHNSIVQTYRGVFFAGERGFYWTDGYDVQKISDEIDETYLNAYDSETKKRAVVGTYDEVNQIVFWTFQESGGSDGLFVFHLRYGIKLDGVFTTWGSYSESTLPVQSVYPVTIPTTVTANFKAKCVLYYKGKVYRGDERGYAFVFDSVENTDPRVVTTDDVSAWGTTAIFYRYETVALNFGTDAIRKWTPKLIATFRNRGNLSVQPRSDRDLTGSPQDCKQIKEVSSFHWQDAGVLWGDPLIYDSGQALTIQQRMLPVPGLRCSYRTITLENAFTTKAKSDVLGLATVNFAAKTALLVNAATEDWPDDLLDYYISFEDDSYNNKFLITIRSADTITFSDPNGLCPANGNYAWVVRGYSKGEVCELSSLALPYAMISDSQEAYRAGGEGMNA